MSKKSSDRKREAPSDKPSDYYLHLVENSSDALYIIDTKIGEFKYLSPSITEILGFTPEEIMEMGVEGIDERTHPGDLLKVRQKTEYILSGKPLPSDFDYYVEKRIKHKAGHYVWLGFNRKFIPDSNGKIEKVVGNIRDITKMKLLQEQLDASVENYKMLYNNARVALYRTRISDGKLLECNELLAKLFGYENREQCLAEYYTVKSYISPQCRNELIKQLEEKGQVDGFEAEARRIDGSVLWVKLSAQMNPEKGYIEGAIWDITASKLLTPMENQILEQIMIGKSSKGIAFEIKRSIRTVEDHRSHIMRKLGVSNLVELTKKATEVGIGPQ